MVEYCNWKKSDVTWVLFCIPICVKSKLLGEIREIITTYGWFTDFSQEKYIWTKALGETQLLISVLQRRHVYKQECDGNKQFIPKYYWHRPSMFRLIEFIYFSQKRIPQGLAKCVFCTENLKQFRDLKQFSDLLQSRLSQTYHLLRWYANHHTQK